MDSLEPTSSAFVALQERINSGTEILSSRKPAYAVAGHPSVFVRTSTGRITIVRRAFVPARRYTTYFSLGFLRTDERITEKKLSAILDKSGIVADDVANRSRGEDDNRRKLLTCRELYSAYCALPKVRALRSFSTIRRLIENYFLNWKTENGEKFSDHPPSYFTPREALSWITYIERKHGPAPAIQARQAVTTMFNKCRKAQLVPANKLFPIIDRDILPTLAPRTDRFTPSQLREFWAATQQLPERDRDLVHILLFSAQRVNQILNLKWAWVDFDENVIHFPAEIMKGGMSYDCPMSIPVQNILKRRLESKSSPYVFPTASGRPLDRGNLSRISELLDCIMSGAKFIGDCRRDRAPFKWSFHGFRRTAQALISNKDHGMTREHKKALIAHKLVSKGDALAHYAADESLFLARHASDFLATEILKIVEPQPEPPEIEVGGNVIHLRQSA